MHQPAFGWLFRSVGIALASTLALTLAAPEASAYAAAGVTTFAQDSQSPGSPSVGPLTDQRSADNPPVVFATISATAGDATAHAEAAVNGLTGAATALVSTAVAADRYRVGRNAYGRAELALNGDIALIGIAPGLATFTALLEGTYGTSGSPLYGLPFDDTVDLAYTVSMGSSAQMGGELHYVCCSSGAYSVPFTWTQLVNPGDIIHFDLYFQAILNSLQGNAGLDMTHTFKLTGIDLPAGYAYTPGTGGFLSQFQPSAAVPEPATAWSMALGLLGALLARARLSRLSAKRQRSVALSVHDNKRVNAVLLRAQRPRTHG